MFCLIFKLFSKFLRHTINLEMLVVHHVKLFNSRVTSPIKIISTTVHAITDLSG